MNNIFFMISMMMLSGYLYSAEKQNRSLMLLPVKRILPEKLNNDVYVEVQDKNTPITIRYFTKKEECCAPGRYFSTESIIPLANIRDNSYMCVVQRESDGASHITFTYKKLKLTITANKYDTFVVNHEYNRCIIIKKSSDVVAQFSTQ